MSTEYATTFLLPTKIVFPIQLCPALPLSQTGEWKADRGDNYLMGIQVNLRIGKGYREFLQAKLISVVFGMIRLHLVKNDPFIGPP